MIFLIAILSAISPRLALFVMWIFGFNKFEIAFDSFWWPLLGFFFLPVTTLVYLLAYSPLFGISSIGWILVVFALMIDLGSYGGGYRGRKSR